MSSTIPIVDMNNWSTNQEKLVNEIRDALHGMGFVYLTNHGVPKELVDNAFAQSKNFFEKSPEIKETVAKDVSKGFHGWAKFNQEKLKVDSAYEFRESFDFFKGRVSFQNSIAQDFEASMSALESACKGLIKKLLVVFGKSLELDDPEFFLKSHLALDDPNIDSFSTLRALYYPPCEETLPVGTVRCGEHTDYGILTLLFQDNMGGLEAKNANKEWIPATPIPGAILVNTGDLLEQWSGGYFPATAHRVLVPEEEIKKKCNRFSIVYFVDPDDTVVVQPLNSKINKESQIHFEPITAYEHCKRKLDQNYI